MNATFDSLTRNMTVARARHSATLLPDGHVLVAGGFVATSPATQSAELYDPSSSTWNATEDMADARSRHTATWLPSGKVLVVGGRSGSGLALATAELFDPVFAAWTAAGDLSVPRDSHTATLLADGRVLVTGGLSLGDGPDNPVEKSAEIYDPNTGTWSLIDHMSHARFGHTATLLADGTVIIAGGAGPRSDGVYTVTVEIYNPASGVWNNVNPMATPRGSHNAVLLLDGTVLVAGGLTLPVNTRHVTAESELFVPGMGRWIRTGHLNVPRGAAGFEACRLANGTVLVAGGRTATAELYDPQIGQWALTGSMAVSRSRPALTQLADGTVLVTGGENFSGAVASAEIYVP